MGYIARYEPATIVNEVNKIIEHAFRPIVNTDRQSVVTSQWMPAVDIKEDKQHFTILADLPGVDKNNINITMEDSILTIKGSRSDTLKEERKNYTRAERAYGSFYRQFTLPDSADNTKIEAKMQKGVLEIIIPKKEEAQPRTIEIQLSD